MAKRFLAPEHLEPSLMLNGKRYKLTEVSDGNNNNISASDSCALNSLKIGQAQHQQVIRQLSTHIQKMEAMIHELFSSQTVVQDYIQSIAEIPTLGETCPDLTREEERQEQQEQQEPAPLFILAASEEPENSNLEEHVQEQLSQTQPDQPIARPEGPVRMLSSLQQTPGTVTVKDMTIERLLASRVFHFKPYDATYTISFDDLKHGGWISTERFQQFFEQHSTSCDGVFHPILASLLPGETPTFRSLFQNNEYLAFKVFSALYEFCKSEEFDITDVLCYAKRQLKSKGSIFHRVQRERAQNYGHRRRGRPSKQAPSRCAVSNPGFFLTAAPAFQCQKSGCGEIFEDKFALETHQLEHEWFCAKFRPNCPPDRYTPS